MKNLKLLFVLSALLLVPKSALALKVSSPLSVDNGTIACSTCSTASGTLTADAVVIGGGSKAVSVVTSNGTGTKMYLSQTSGATPSWAQIAIGDLAAFDSAALFGKLSDETGSGSGTPLAVFNQGPTINGVTGTGTWGLTGATVNLPASAVDAITEIHTDIKTGGSNAVKVATIGSTALVNGQCIEADGNGNLVPSGGACGGSSINPRVMIHSQTPVTVTSGTPVFMSLGGAVSTTESDVRTPFNSNTTFG
ncbi:MAG TPA: hypothetical protein PLD02_14680, partial [Saprospiraceae bacterium]|nr:hypothetical protein [Saprospiraceae bacterium]